MRETKEPGLDLGMGEFWAASEQGRQGQTQVSHQIFLAAVGVRVQRACGQSSWLGGSEEELDLVVEAKKDGVTGHRCCNGLHVGGKQGRRQG